MGPLYDRSKACSRLARRGINTASEGPVRQRSRGSNPPTSTKTRTILEGCAFLVDKVFFWDTKGFFWIQKKLFLTFSEINGVSSIVQFFLTFWKVKNGKSGGVERSATQQQPLKQLQKDLTQQQKVYHPSGKPNHLALNLVCPPVAPSGLCRCFCCCFWTADR